MAKVAAKKAKRVPGGGKKYQRDDNGRAVIPPKDGEGTVATKLRPVDPAMDINSLRPSKVLAVVKLRELDPDERDSLERAISDGGSYGPSNPIVLYKGEILEGNHRYLCARKMKVKLTVDDFREFVGTVDEAKRFVLDTNLARRHYGAGERLDIVQALMADLGMKLAGPKRGRPSKMCHMTQFPMLTLRRQPTFRGVRFNGVGQRHADHQSKVRLQHGMIARSR
jgi:hypothetical protein